jgi:hypothetical protein
MEDSGSLVFTLVLAKLELGFFVVAPDKEQSGSAYLTPRTRGGQAVEIAGTSGRRQRPATKPNTLFGNMR